MNPRPDDAWETPGAPYVNEWKTVEFTPAAVARPRSVDEVVAVVKRAAEAGLRVKAVGGGHSFNRIVATDGVQVDLRHLNRVVDVDLDARTVEVEAGLTIGDAIEQLAPRGLHFPTLGSWFTQSLAGAISTSTHGSGLVHGSLSDHVLEVEAVLADGSVIRVGGDDPRARALRAHLGQLGLITRVKLRLDPAFWLSCDIRTMPDVEGFSTIVEVARREEYANMLWLPYANEACIRVLKRTDDRTRNAASLALERKFSRKGRLGNTLLDVGVFLYGHAYLRLPRLLSSAYSRSVRKSFMDDQANIDVSHRIFLYDRLREPTENHQLRLILNSEYAVELPRLTPVMVEVKRVIDEYRKRGIVLNYPRIHVRFAPASDRTLIGLNAGRDTAYVGIYVVGSIRHAPQIPLAEAIESIFIENEGRPHWGKYRYLDDDRFERTYPELSTFRRIRSDLDPSGLFSDGSRMFTGLNRFTRPSRKKMLASLFDRSTYQPIRTFE